MSTKGKAPGPQPTKRNALSRSTIKDLERRIEATADRPNGARSAQEPLMLRIRLDGPVPVADEDPRLKHLPQIDRQSFLQVAGIALGITHAEYLEAISIFFQISESNEPRRQEQWMKIARILRALYCEVTNENSPFLKEVDAAARSILTQNRIDWLFTARAAAFMRIRDELVQYLQRNMTSDTLSMFLLLDLAEPQSHEIARHIPDLDTEMVHREIGSQRYKRAKKALHRARHSKAAERDVTTQAECMIRAWLRAMECPEEIVKSAFDAERARDERQLGQRK